MYVLSQSSNFLVICDLSQGGNFQEGVGVVFLPVAQLPKATGWPIFLRQTGLGLIIT